MDIDHLSIVLDQDLKKHRAKYHSTLQYCRETQESIGNCPGGQDSITSDAAQSLRDSVEGFASACDSFRTTRSAVVRGEERGYELRGAAVKSMLSGWLDEITKETATLTPVPINPEISTLYQQRLQGLEKLDRSAQILADPCGNKMKVQAKRLKTLLDGDTFTQLSFSKRRAQEVQLTFPNTYTRVQTLVDETNALVSGHPKYANDSPWPQSESCIPEGLPPPTDKSMFKAYKDAIEEVETLLEKLRDEPDQRGLFDSETTQTASKAVWDSMYNSVKDITKELSGHLQAMHGYR
jgi:hypothetical protein